MFKSEIIVRINFRFIWYRKVLPIRPGFDPKWLGNKTPFSKKYRKLEKKYGQISITVPDLDPEKIEKFDDRFGTKF